MRTVRVRVFVSVKPNGTWLGYGHWSVRPEDTIIRNTAHKSSKDIGYWIEADLPLPNQSPEIVATVTRA